MEKNTILFALILIATVVASFAAASNMDVAHIVCQVVNPIKGTVSTIAPTIVITAFIYGGIRYTFSADDPSGRTQGRNICIHALIAAILLLLVTAILTSMGLLTACPSS